LGTTTTGANFHCRFGRDKNLALRPTAPRPHPFPPISVPARGHSEEMSGMPAQFGPPQKLFTTRRLRPIRSAVSSLFRAVVTAGRWGSPIQRPRTCRPLPAGPVGRGLPARHRATSTPFSCGQNGITGMTLRSSDILPSHADEAGRRMLQFIQKNDLIARHHPAPAWGFCSHGPKQSPCPPGPDEWRC